jgi:hypothetical protein
MTSKSTSVIDDQISRAREAEQVHQAALARYRARVSEPVEMSDASLPARLGPIIQERTQMSDSRNQFELAAQAKAYAALSPVARARLASQEPKRFRELKRAHGQRIDDLAAQRSTARSWAERQRIGREIAELTGAADGPEAA